MFDPNHIHLLRALQEIQAARAANWPSPQCPTDADLERTHADQIASIQQQISAPQVRESENTPAAVDDSKSPLWFTAAAGNILRRVFRQ